MQKIKLLLVTTLFLGIFTYFVYHTIEGNRGYLAKIKVEKDILVANEELEKLRASRVEIEHQVKLLRPETLDKDMLEEQARKILGVAKSEEEIVVNEGDLETKTNIKE